MRYGMNPHQAAAVIGDAGAVSVVAGEPSLINYRPVSPAVASTNARLLTGADGLPSRTVGDALLALITLRYTQSNSIAVVQDGMTLGIGAGQQNRWIASGWRWPRRGCGGCGATGMSGSFLRSPG